jgi:hypothetical protein
LDALLCELFFGFSLPLELAGNDGQENQWLPARVTQAVAMPFQREKHVTGVRRQFNPVVQEYPGARDNPIDFLVAGVNMLSYHRTGIQLNAGCLMKPAIRYSCVRGYRVKAIPSSQTAGETLPALPLHAFIFEYHALESSCQSNQSRDSSNFVLLVPSAEKRWDYREGGIRVSRMKWIK